MARFVVRRLGQMVLVLFAVSALTFLIFNVIPGGDPAVRMAGRHPDPGQLGEGIVRVGPLGVNHGHGIRNLAQRGVVVGDDDVKPHLTGFIDLKHVRDTAIYGNDETDTLFAEDFQRPRRQAVSLRLAVGDIGDGVAPESLQPQHQGRRGGHAVGVIIAVNAYLLTGE